jgi:hypothetical protein
MRTSSSLQPVLRRRLRHLRYFLRRFRPCQKCRSAPYSHWTRKPCSKLGPKSRPAWPAWLRAPVRRRVRVSAREQASPPASARASRRVAWPNCPRSALRERTKPLSKRAEESQQQSGTFVGPCPSPLPPALQISTSNVGPGRPFRSGRSGSAGGGGEYTPRHICSQTQRNTIRKLDFQRSAPRRALRNCDLVVFGKKGERWNKSCPGRNARAFR